MVLSEVTGGVAGGAAEHQVRLGGVASREAHLASHGLRAFRACAGQSTGGGGGLAAMWTGCVVLAAGLLQDPLFGAWLSGCR